MKKILIVLIIITTGLIGLNVYEYMNMQEAISQYQNTNNKYCELLAEEIDNNSTIELLDDNLNGLISENISTNEEYNIWTNLNKTIQNLLK